MGARKLCATAHHVNYHTEMMRFLGFRPCGSKRRKSAGIAYFFVILVELYAIASSKIAQKRSAISPHSPTAEPGDNRQGRLGGPRSIVNPRLASIEVSLPPRDENQLELALIDEGGAPQ